MVFVNAASGIADAYDEPCGITVHIEVNMFFIRVAYRIKSVVHKVAEHCHKGVASPGGKGRDDAVAADRQRNAKLIGPAELALQKPHHNRLPDVGLDA